MDRTDVQRILEAKGYTLKKQGHLGMLFTKMQGAILIEAQCSESKGFWACQLKHGGLRHKLELSTGYFAITNPNFDVFQLQLIVYIKACTSTHEDQR